MDWEQTQSNLQDSVLGRSPPLWNQVHKIWRIQCSWHNLMRINQSVKTSIIPNKEWSIRILSEKYWIGSDPNYANKDTKKTTTEKKQVLVALTDHGFIYKVRNSSPGGIHFVQSSSQNGCISRPIVVTVLVGSLSTQTSVRLYRSESSGLHVKSSQLIRLVPLTPLGWGRKVSGHASQ